MGNQLQSLSKLPDESTHIGPSFRTPLTDIAAPLMHFDTEPCSNFEGRYLNCLEAYGDRRGLKICKEYFQDMMECAHKQKQERRLQAMMQERWKQYVNGLVGRGPKVPQYMEPAPALDAFAPHELHMD